MAGVDVKPSREKTKPKIIGYGVVALVILLVLLVLIPSSGGQLQAAKRTYTANELSQVQAATLGYYTEYSVYPVAPDNATLVKMLEKANPRSIEFLSLNPRQVNAGGEMLDAWGTPLRLSVSANGVLHASSAGPDKIFGTPDDITGDVVPPEDLSPK